MNLTMSAVHFVHEASSFALQRFEKTDRLNEREVISTVKKALSINTGSKECPDDLIVLALFHSSTVIS